MESQELLDSPGEHGIVSGMELIPIQNINKACERLLKNDVNYHFEIDTAPLR
ncbi:MAG TPA: hypothetical protein VMA13_09620 [Candidatus Saccharimonadales bacterium]|nr:hypothetical protein [Candidatus Saccharimonadales bacterium]